MTTAAPARRWKPSVGDFEGCYVTPRRARTVRAGIEAERWDAVRAGELDVLPHTGRPPWFGIDPPEELPAAAKQGAAHDADGPAGDDGPAVQSGTATSQAGGGAAPSRAAAGPSRPCGICGGRPSRLYLSGWRCASCAPPAPPTADPARTAAGLRERRERHIRALTKGRR